jgi:hypothetical protein
VSAFARDTPDLTTDPHELRFPPTSRNGTVPRLPFLLPDSGFCSDDLGHTMTLTDGLLVLMYDFVTPLVPGMIAW